MSDRSITRRRWLWKNGHRRCHYCGRKLALKAHKAAPNLLTADHVVPRAQGGTDRRSNLVAACPACNRFKGASTFIEPKP